MIILCWCSVMYASLFEYHHITFGEMPCTRKTNGIKQSSVIEDLLQCYVQEYYNLNLFLLFHMSLNNISVHICHSLGQRTDNDQIKQVNAEWGQLSCAALLFYFCPNKIISINHSEEALCKNPNFMSALKDMVQEFVSQNIFIVKYCHLLVFQLLYKQTLSSF